MTDNHFVCACGNQSPYEGIKSKTQNAQSRSFKSIAVTTRLLLNVKRHVYNAKTGNGFNKTINARTKYGQTFVFKTHVGREKPFSNVINDRKVAQLKS